MATNSRSREYFKERKRGLKIIAEGGYWMRIRKQKIIWCISFAERRKSMKHLKNRHFRVVLQYPLNKEPNPERSVATDSK